MCDVLEVIVIVSTVLLGQSSLRVGMPLHIGFYVGLISFLVAFKVGYRIGTIIGYFVFLLYVGSLLVLFGYTLCLFPNQRFTKEYVVGPGIFFLCASMSVIMGVVGETSHEFFSGGNSSFLGNFFVNAPGAGGYAFIAAYLFYMLILTTGFCRKGYEPLRMWFSNQDNVRQWKG